MIIYIYMWYGLLGSISFPWLHTSSKYITGTHKSTFFLCNALHGYKTLRKVWEPFSKSLWGPSSKLLQGSKNWLVVVRSSLVPYFSPPFPRHNPRPHFHHYLPYHPMLNTPNMASPFLFLHLAPTHSAIYFNLIIFCIYFFPILCPSLTLSGVLSLHLFRWARHMTSSIIFSEPVQNLKAPTFPTLLFPICNVPSKCFFVLTCFARPLFLILHSHISQGISILSTTDIPLSIWTGEKYPLCDFAHNMFRKKSRFYG